MQRIYKIHGPRCLWSVKKKVLKKKKKTMQNFKCPVRKQDRVGSSVYKHDCTTDKPRLKLTIDSIKEWPLSFRYR